MTFLLPLLVKSTLLLILCGLALLCQRRASASARHLVCLLTLAALLALPLFSATLPGWHLPVLSQSKSEPEPTPARSSPALPVREGEELNQVSSPVFSEPAAPPAARSASSLAERTPAKQGGRFLALYIFGVLLASVRPLLGLRGIAHLRRVCIPIADPPTLTLAAEAAAALGLKRPPLLCRADVPVPMTWGWRRPVVLLPPASIDWPADRLHAVLLHETAHVVRRDWPGHRLADFACAAYWFHPGVWLVARRLRTESEIACDDLVLSSGVPTAEYAGHLLEIAQTLPGAFRPPQSAIAMAQTSRIERRLTMILDPAQNRRAVARRVLLLALVPSTAVLVTLAVLRPIAKAQADNAKVSRTYYDIDMVPALAGVTNPGKYGGQWWSASGALLSKPIYNRMPFHAANLGSADANDISFAFRLPPAARGVTVQYRLPQSTESSWDGTWPGKTQDDAGRTESQVFAGSGGTRIVTAGYPPGLKTATVQVGIAAGEWKTAFNRTLNTGGVAGATTTVSLSSHAFLAGDAIETPKGTALIVSTDTQDDVRIIALDKRGNVVFPADIGDESTNSLKQITAHFSQPLSQIKEFRVETRPFQWIEFKDVALQPSGAVSIPAAPIPGITPAGTAATTARLHQIYGFIQTFRKMNNGASPNEYLDELARDMATHPADYHLPDKNVPNYAQAISYFTSPDSRFMPGISPDMVKGFIVYKFLRKRPDGTSVGTAKAAGTRDVLAYTNLYVRSYPDGDVGFYLVLWEDGTVSQVPAALARMVAAYDVDKTWAAPESIKKRWIQPAFPGQAGQPRT